MQNFLETIAKRSSVFIIFVGCLVLILGTANGISINSISLTFPDATGRWVTIITGIVLIAFGLYLVTHEKPDRTNPIEATPSLKRLISTKYHPLFEEPYLITANSKNRSRIPSDFIHWDKCTIMLWVLVPPQGERLRNSPPEHSRYIIAHQTGKWNYERIEWTNLFALRYAQNKWQVAISNNQAERVSPTISIPDGLTPDWHHFLITWNRPKSELYFCIDGKPNRFAQSLSNWTTTLASEVTIGTWGADDEEYNNRYCETQLFNLVIVKEYLKPSDIPAMEHFNLKPG
jgi:hypothetical protein